MTNIISALGFLGFVVLAVILAAMPGADPRRRRLASALILYCLAMSGGAVVLARDLWPFSNWPMMPKIAPTKAGDGGAYRPRLAGATRNGVEYLVDYRVWEPLNEDELAYWLYHMLPELSPQRQDSVGAYLLRAANAGREATRAGHAPGYLAHLLGPLTVPGHLVHEKLWRRPGDVPAEPFVELRLYRERWDVDARAHDPRAVQFDLLYRYPRGP
jgi:hypothetical protein